MGGDTGSLSKELYENSKNRMIIKNRNDVNINLLWKNCKEKLADDKSLFSSIGKVISSQEDNKNVSKSSKSKQTLSQILKYVEKTFSLSMQESF